jgi:hypothetical protein
MGNGKKREQDRRRGNGGRREVNYLDEKATVIE